MILIESIIGAFEAVPYPANATEWAATILAGLLPGGVAWLVGAVL